MPDVIIIGAGPAGIQAAYSLKKLGVSYKLIEKSAIPGAFFKTHPRHRMLISINKRYTGSDNPEFNLRHDWNSLIAENGLRFTNYDDDLFPKADRLLEYLADFVEKENIDIDFNTEVKLVNKVDDIFEIHLACGEVLKGKHVVVATGFNSGYQPDLPGIEHAIDYSDMSIDKQDYINKRVLIIGKGNSAFETGDHLADSAAVVHLVSPESLRLAWQSHYVGHLRAVNNNILDMYQLKSQHGILDASVQSIIKTDKGFEVQMNYLHAEGESETLNYDTILCCTGFKFDPSIFSGNCTPARTRQDKYPELNHAYESVNVPNLYFAGTLTHANDHQKGTSGFIHGFRYNVVALANILKNRLTGEAIESLSISRNNTELAIFMLERFNQASSTWQQPGVLAEVFKLNEDSVEYFEALPVEYATDEYFANDEVILFTFEYGSPPDGSIFEQQRIARDNTDNAEASVFLHPILRYYSKGKLVKTFHVIEDLEAQWTIDEHLAHLLAFIDTI